MIKKFFIALTSFVLCGSVVSMCACGDANETIKEDPAFIDMSGMTETEALAQYGYYSVDKDGNKSYSVGDEIHFGSYPSTLVEDATLLASLNKDLSNPEENAEGWVSYRFYDEGAAADYAWYLDRELDGVNYRAVYLTKYRGVSYDVAASSEASGQHGATQALGEVYWYRYETLVWRILGYSENVAYLSCLDVIDYMPFKAEPSAGGADNDWAQSDMRRWLNEDFIKFAFTDAQQRLILQTELDNASSCYRNYGEGLTPTTDRVFLMSYQDMVNTDYGFTGTTAFHLQSSQGVENLNNSSIEAVAQAMYRRRGATPYALALSTEYSVTCLSDRGYYASMFAARSAGNKGTSLSSVDKYGDLSTGSLSVYTVTGVVPALNLQIGKSV